MIDYQCPHCGKKLKIPDDEAGYPGTCSHCQGRISVPFPIPDLAPSREAKRASGDGWFKCRCPHCSKELKITLEAAGKKGRCKYCKGLFHASMFTPDSPQTEPPPLPGSSRSSDSTKTGKTLFSRLRRPVTDRDMLVFLAVATTVLVVVSALNGFKERDARRPETPTRKFVTEMTPTGSTPESSSFAAASDPDKDEGQRWVMTNVVPGMVWNPSFWRKRFGDFEEVPVQTGYDRAKKAYYFESIDMTIHVLVLRDPPEIATWRLGRSG